mmetsp:Transcript_19243/g.45874  ORF Transcript_19243/g.45874 Transcript_19243/m.45874 type:complete len:245 (-) Transcript_19243:348-1082(-)
MSAAIGALTSFRLSISIQRVRAVLATPMYTREGSGTSWRVARPCCRPSELPKTSNPAAMQLEPARTASCRAISCWVLSSIALVTDSDRNLWVPNKTADRMHHASPAFGVVSEVVSRPTPRSATTAATQVLVGTDLPENPTSMGTIRTVKVPVRAPCEAVVEDRPTACARYPAKSHRPSSVADFRTSLFLTPSTIQGAKQTAAMLKRTADRSAGGQLSSAAFITVLFVPNNIAPIFRRIRPFVLP